MRNKKLRTIGARLTVMLVVSALIMCLALCAFTVFISWNEYTEFFSDKAREAASIAARYVDGDRIRSYIETGETDAYYEELEDRLRVIKTENNIKFLYIFVPGETSFTYVMDVMVETDDPEMMSALGDIYEYTELEYEHLLPDVAAKRASSEKIVLLENFYGPGVSAWAPVFDSTGELVAMVEADMALDIVINALTSFVLSMVIVSCGVVLIIVLVMAIFTKRTVAKPIARLTDNVRDFTKGESISEFKNDVKTGDEFQTLSEAFGKMAEDIDKYTKNLASVAADKERIATELDLATNIQMSLLPSVFPAFPNRYEFDLYAVMKPAKVVGGDFYDFFMTDKSHLCAVVGGVTGKGIPAALFMVVAKTIIKNQMMTGAPLAEAMTVINSRIYESSTTDVHVSAFVCVLDTQSGCLSYVNAGAHRPLIMRKDGSYDTLVGPDMTMLAETENVVYRSVDVKLYQGDRFVAFSNGAISAKDTQGNVFELDKLKNALNEREYKSALPGEAIVAVCDEIERFESGAERDEDITLLMLEYKKGDRENAQVLARATESGFDTVRAFLKRQLAENGITGADYAVLSVVSEEMFTLMSSKTGSNNEIAVRCSILGEDEKTITVAMSFPGIKQDLLSNLTDAQKDAVDFITKNTDELSARYTAGKNELIAIKTV